MSASASGRDVVIDEALLISRLGGLPAEVTDQVLAGSHDITVPMGGLVFRDGDGPLVLLVVHGLLRTYLATSAGRELTIRYSRPGAIVGVGQPDRPARGRTRPGPRADAVRPPAGRDPTAPGPYGRARGLRALSRVQRPARRLHGAGRGHLLSTLRQRVARHLLDFAAADPTGPTPLLARLSQQALAQHVGSVREVVLRILGELRDEAWSRRRGTRS